MRHCQFCIHVISDMLAASSCSSADPHGIDLFRQHVRREFTKRCGLTMKHIRAQKKGKDILILGTIHQAQGNEWHWVFAPEWDRTCLPHIVQLGGELAADEFHAQYTLASCPMNVFVQMPLAYYATKEGVDEEALRALFQAPAKPQPSSYKTFGQTQSTPASAKHTRCAPAAVGATEEERIAAMAVLGIDEWPCDAQLVRTTARRAYREAHPDKGGDNASAQARFRAIYDARALLLRLLPA